MSFKLYTYPNNYRANKALIAAQYGGIKIETPAFQIGKDNKSASFLKLNPLGKVPTLETPEGGIFESNAIARYVARLRADSGLYGSTFFESGQIDAWIDFSTTELEPARGAWLYPIYKYIQFNQAAYEKAKSDVAKALTLLNNYLLSNTYLVGNRITLADIVIVSALVDLYSKVFAPSFIAPFGNVTRWFTTCINQPQFSAVIGKVEFAKEELLAEGAKATKSEEKPVVVAKPVETPVEAAKKELAPTALILDNVKRSAFTIKPFNPAFFDELWGQIEPQAWCFYEANYQYNSDNKVCFMTNNLVDGFIQRSESARKVSFGVVNVLAKDETSPPFKVVAAYLFRGDEVPEEMAKDNPDAEYYTWTKIDVSTDAGKARVKELFESETINGENVLDRKYFK